MNCYLFNNGMRTNYLKRWLYSFQILFFCKVKYLLIILSFIPLIGKSQMLDNSKGNAFTDVPFFNQEFIKNNKIKILKGTYTHKKMGDILRDTEFIVDFEFNEQGQLIKGYETKKYENTIDTLVSFYGYNASGKLKYKRDKDHRGFFSTHYEYDKKGRIIRQEYRRDIDSLNSSISPVFERSTVINFETMSYEDFTNQTKKTIYNNYGFPYLDEMSYYHSDGYLLSREERLKMTYETKKTVYSYTEKGWISKITSVSSANSNANQEIEFKYDEDGNVTEKAIYKNGDFLVDIQIIYNSKTGLISYLLSRDVKSNFITILKFNQYEYFE